LREADWQVVQAVGTSVVLEGLLVRERQVACPERVVGPAFLPAVWLAVLPV
jgi:hypothetical protein